METDDFGLEIRDQIARRGVERAAVGAGQRRLRVESQFDVILRELLFPGEVTLSVGCGRLVSEEVDVDGM